MGVLKAFLRRTGKGRKGLVHETTPEYDPKIEAEWVESLLQADIPALSALHLVFGDWNMESVDGEILNGTGYLLRDQHDLAVSYDDFRLGKQGVLITKVAGISYRPKAAQDEAFAPGNIVLLLRDAENPHDQNAVGIWDAKLATQVGFIPRELAPSVSRRLDEGEQLSAVSVWQWHKLGQRVGLKILVGPSARVRALLQTCE